MDLKEAGDWIYMVGDTRDELGGGHVWKVVGKPPKGHVPRVHVSRAQEIFTLVHQAIVRGYVRACHDLSEGGLAVTAAEMAFAGELGMSLDIAKAPGAVKLTDVTVLFSESPSRFLVEVPAVAKKGFEMLFKGYVGCLGRVTKSKSLVLRDSRTGRTLVKEPVLSLRRAWEGK